MKNNGYLKQGAGGWELEISGDNRERTAEGSATAD